jgi:hypothetical protein
MMSNPLFVFGDGSRCALSAPSIAALPTSFSFPTVFFLTCLCPCPDDESDSGWGRRVGGATMVKMGKKVVVELG